VKGGWCGVVVGEEGGGRGGGGWRRKKTGETGVTVDRDKIEFRLFNSSSIFNKPLGKEVTLHQRFY